MVSKVKQDKSYHRGCQQAYMFTVTELTFIAGIMFSILIVLECKKKKNKDKVVLMSVV